MGSPANGEKEARIGAERANHRELRILSMSERCGGRGRPRAKPKIRNGSGATHAVVREVPVAEVTAHMGITSRAYGSQGTHVGKQPLVGWWVVPETR
jgi:hypothetical protein